VIDTDQTTYSVTRQKERKRERERNFLNYVAKWVPGGSFCCLACLLVQLSPLGLEN